MRLTVVNESGKEAVVGILGRGDFAGEGCLAGQSVCAATATAIAPTTVLVIEKNEMIRVLHGEHGFSDRFIAYMLTRNIRVQEDLIDQLFNSSEKRLARTLLLLARYGAPRSAAKNARQSVTRDAGGDDRNDAASSQLFHEQVQKTGVHRVRRGAARPSNQQIPPKCCPARLSSPRAIRVSQTLLHTNSSETSPARERERNANVCRCEQISVFALRSIAA